MKGTATVMPSPTPQPPDARYPHPRHAAQTSQPSGPYAQPLTPPWLSPPPATTAQAPADHPPPAPDGGYRREPTTQAYPQIHPPEPPSPWDEALPDLRNKIVNRLVDLNWNQVTTTWERRRNDPLNPHVLVVFFAEPPTGRPPRCQLRIAARLFFAADQSRLAMLLHEMTGVVRGHVTAGRDLTRYLYSWHDPMPHSAQYAGLGVSSLDTPAGTWAKAQQFARDDMDIPGRCYAHLVDGSLLLADRLARDDFGACRVWSSDPVWDVSGERRRRTRTARDIATSEEYGPDNRAIWQWLSELHHVLSGAHHDR